MSDVTPPELVPSDAPTRDRRFIWTAAASLLLHAGVVAWLLWPTIRETAEAAPPPAIAVDLVPEEELSSSEPPASSEQPSSEISSSVQPSSSEQASASSEAPSAEPSAPASESASAESPSIAPAPSAPSEAPSEATSSAPASDASSTAPSSAPESSSAAASEPPSTQPASEPPPSAPSEQPPTPATRPIVIPVGPSDDSSEHASELDDNLAPSAEASSAPPDEQISALTAEGSETEDGIAAPASSSAEPAAQPLPELGALHTSKRFYSEAILSAPAMAKAREAIAKLPREKRLAQTCNIEAVGQLGNAGRNFSPDAVIADAFAKPAIEGTRFTVGGGAFRSREKWYAVSYTCTLSKELRSVTSFSYRLGGDVTAALTRRVGKK